MRWEQGRRSTNVEDRRGRGVGRTTAVGGGGLVLVVAVVMMLMGKNPAALLEAAGQGGAGASVPAQAPRNPQEDRAAEFVSVVLASTEDVWSQYFQRSGQTYQQPTLVLFRDAVESACGFQQAAVGPFYCPGDQKLYIDLTFFDELARMGAPGDFAQAYVVGHEIGHHLQTILGISDQLRNQKRGMSEVEQNAVSVMQELQADCFAGVWAHHAQGMLEAGDVEEGIAAATSIGDDTLQRRAGVRVSPESWTHGSSAQRVQWFRTGMQGGRLEACDTYGRSR